MLAIGGGGRAGGGGGTIGPCNEHNNLHFGNE